MKNKEKTPLTNTLKNHYIIHIALFAFIFNMLPLFFISADSSGFIVYLLLIGFPVISFVAAFIFALFNGFHILYNLFPILLFIPCAFIYFNFTALPYAIIYGICSILGMTAGYILPKLLKNKSKDGKVK